MPIFPGLSRRHVLSAALAIGVAAASIGLASCGGGGGSTPSVLRRSTSDEPRSLDPYMVPGNAGAALMYDMFEGLLSIDAGGKLIPGLAQSYTVSPDGLTYTFKLRENLKWSDGKPITAEDFVWSFRRSADPKEATRSGRVLAPLKNFRAIVRGKAPVETLGVSAPDANTVVIQVEQPTSYLPDIVASFSSAVVPRHAIEKFKEKWTTPENIVVSGAYTLEEWVGNTHIKLKKNPNYHDAANVKIERVMFFPVEKPQTAFTRYKAGELDVVFNVPVNQIDQIKKEYPGQLHSSPVIGLFYVLLNNEKAPTSDPRVRRALSLVVDRDLIANTLLKNEASPAYSVVPAAMPNYTPSGLDFQGQPMAARKEEARRLLAEAGYTPARPLKIVYKFGGQEQNRRVAVALQTMWKEVGIDAVLENVGANGVVTDAREGDYQAMRYTYYAPYPDPVAFLNLFETDANTNFSGYANAAWDKALRSADATLDPKARTEALRSVEAKLMADNPVIPVYFNTRWYLVSPKVKGWVDNARGEHLSRYLSFGN